MSSLRPSLATACLLVLLAGPLLAQDEAPASQATPVDTMADVLVLDQHYSAGAGELARVFLESGQVYRGELSSPEVTLAIRAVGGRIRAPRVYPILGPESSSEASVVELYPDADGIYEIRAVGARGGAIATHLRLYRDIRESHRRVALVNKPGWEIGFEIAGGWHSGFAQSGALLVAGAPAPHAGTDVEACFTARRELGRTGFCVLGIGYQSQVGDRSILWFFTEPRLLLVGNPARKATKWEAGALFRFGLGSVERMAPTPLMFAPGAYVARQIHSGAHGPSWTIQGSYSHAWFTGFPEPFGRAGTQPHGDRITLGLAWYQ
jgi:hypothetical protein